MLVQLTSDNLGDFEQRFRGVWGWYTNGDKKRLIRINEVAPSGVSFSDVNGESYLCYPDKGGMFEFIPVKRGFYVGKSGKLYHLSRKPARQYKRGIAAENTACLSLVKLETLAGWAPVSMGNWVPDIFNEDMKESFNRINSRFALGTDEKVYFHMLEVGAWKDNKIMLTTPLIAQELSDAVKRSALHKHMEICV